MAQEQFDLDALRKKLGNQTFSQVMVYAIRIAQFQEELGLELVYQDEELLTFRHVKPLADKLISRQNA